MEITGGTGAPGPAGPAGPATKGQDANYLVWIDPSNSNKATAYNTHTGVNDYTGTTTDVVLSSILTALGSGGGVVKLSPDTHTWAATITPTAPIRLVGSGVATVISVSGNITPFVLNGTDQAIERMTINGNGSTAHALTSAGATRMHVDWVRVTGFAGFPVVCTGTHSHSLIEHLQLDGNTGGTDIDCSAATGVDLDRLAIDGDTATNYVLLGTSCSLRRSSLKSPSTGTTFRSGVLAMGADCAVESNAITWTNGNTSGSSPVIGFAIVGNVTGSDRLRVVDNDILGDFTTSGIGIGVSGSSGFNSTATDAYVAHNVIRNVIGDAILSGNPHNSHAGHVIIGNVCDGASFPTAPTGFSSTCIEMHGADISVSGNTVYNVGAHGIYLDGVGSTATGNTVRLFAQDTNQDFCGGIVVTSPGCTVTGNTCLDGGTATNTHVAGILLRSDYSGSPTVRCVVSGNRCGDSRSGASRTQAYGLRIYNANDQTDSNTYANNDLSNNVTSAVSDNGGPGGNPNGTGSTTSRFLHNTGYNPVGVNIRGGQPAMVSSGTVVVNTYSHPVNVYVSAGTGAPSNPTKVNATSTGVILGTFHLGPGDNIQLNGYTGTTPAWLWVGE